MSDSARLNTVVFLGCILALTAAAPSLAAPVVGPHWIQKTHSACCEGNIASTDNATVVLAPILDGEWMFRTTDGGANWSQCYPPAPVPPGTSVLPYGIEGDLRAYHTDVIHFGTLLASAIAASSSDEGVTWTLAPVPIIPAVNDQAWEYIAPIANLCPAGVTQTKPYVLAGWMRVGAQVAFSCTGGLTWPIITPLPGNFGDTVHPVCENLTHLPAAAADTRMANAEFARMRGGVHGGFGTDGKFYWVHVANNQFYICNTATFGAVWSGVIHPFAPDQVVESITHVAFDQKGTMYILYGKTLYTSFDYGENFKYIHDVPGHYGDFAAGDGYGDPGADEEFVVDNGTISIGVKSSDDKVYFKRGVGVDTPNPTWFESFVADQGSKRLDFMMITKDRNGNVILAYTDAGAGDTTTAALKNQAPGANNDSASAVTAVSKTIAILANDTDADNDPLTVLSVSTPAHGSAVLNADKTVTYTSSAGYVGGDSFTYQVDDGFVTKTATVTIDVGAPETGLSFYTVAPCRTYDSRLLGPSGRLAAGQARALTLTGSCGVPASAKALSFNITVAGPTAGGSLILYPGGQSAPATSGISFATGQTRANNAVIGLGSGTGTLGVTANMASGDTDLFVDVNGYLE